MSSFVPPVISVHRPEAISGINAWGARMSRTPTWMDRWRLMLAGARERVAASDANLALWAAWDEHDSPATQVRRVIEALRAADPSVVVCNDSVHAYIAVALLRHRGFRALGVGHTGHDAEEDFYRLCGPLADRWVVVSRAAAARFAPYLAMHHAPGVIPCGVEMDGPAGSGEQGATAREGLLRVLYAGRLDQHCKRVLDLTRLADALAGRGVAFHLTIVGDGSAAERLRTGLRGHMDAGRAVMLGRVSAAEVASLYESHDVLVMTSAFEGSPVTVAEASAAGLVPAITTGCGGAAEVVRDGVEGIIVGIGDMETMAERLAGLARDARAMGRMKDAAWHLARRVYDIRAHAFAYADVAHACALAPKRVREVDSVTIKRHWSLVAGAMGLLGPCDEGELRSLASWWLGDMGVAGDVLDGESMRVPRVVSYAERTAHAAVERAAAAGYRRIALFGAGAHTRRIAPMLGESPRIVAILDDLAGHGAPGEIGGVPVRRPEEAAKLGIEAVIVSSDEFEDELAVRAGQVCGVVLRMYGGLH